MDADADLTRLADAWHAIEQGTDLNLAEVWRRRRRQRGLVALELAASAVGFVAAAIFWLEAEGPLFRLAAAVMLAAGCVGAVVAWRQRTPLVRWGDWTPGGVLAFRLRECEAALVAARLGIVSVAVLLAFCVLLSGAAVLLQDRQALAVYRLYALCVAVSSVVVGIWSARLLRAKRAERLQLRAIAAQLGEEGLGEV